MPLGLCDCCNRAFILDEAVDTPPDCPGCARPVRIAPVRHSDDLPRLRLEILRTGPGKGRKPHS